MKNFYLNRCKYGHLRWKDYDDCMEITFHKYLTQLKIVLIDGTH